MSERPINCMDCRYGVVEYPAWSSRGQVDCYRKRPGAFGFRRMVKRWNGRGADPAGFRRPKHVEPPADCPLKEAVVT